MIHLVLDSSVYRRSPRLDSPEFKILSYLASTGSLTLHLPYIVEREFTSYLEQIQKERIELATRKITSALNFDGHGPKSQGLSIILEKLKADAQELVAERSESFIHWIEAHDAVRHPISIENSHSALEAYFTGQPPLKEPKVRNDIPDSFIFQQILDLKNDYAAELGLVIEDNALRSACTDAEIDCWSKLADFLASPVAQEFLTQAVIQENEAEISEFVSGIANENIVEITSELEKLMLSSDYSTLSGDMIPGEFNQIYLSGVDTPYDVEIENIEYLGGTVFLIDVIGNVDLTYEFSVHIYDAYALDEDKFHISPLNEHYVEVETTDQFTFKGQVEFEFTEAVIASTTVDEMKAALKGPNIRATDLDDFELVVDDDLGELE